MAEETVAIDRTEQPTALVYLTRLPGNGVVAGFGYIKAFAFDIPTALRRLADELEKPDGASLRSMAHPPGDDYETSVGSLDLSVRAWNGLSRAFESTDFDHVPIPWWNDAQKLPFRAVLDLRSHPNKNFGAGSFAEVCEVLQQRGVCYDELRRSKWWATAPSNWRNRWELRREAILK